MEHVDGQTLARTIAGRRSGAPDPGSLFCADGTGPIDFRRVARAFSEVAEGLHHAHREGVIHRDVKPSNLMVEWEGRLRLLDFGLAHFEDMATLTLTGTVMGTPLYMSPEQARRETVAVDHRSDIYSLGATLYEVLTLQPPFEGRDRHDLLRRIVDGDPPPPRALQPLVPRELETIVLQAMRTDPDGRYRTALAMAQDLSRFVRGEPVEAKPDRVWARRWRRLRRHRGRILAGAALLATLVTVAWLGVEASRAERERARALYPAKLRGVVGSLDSGRWVLGAASRPLPAPGIGFQVFQAEDFRDVVEIGGARVVRRATDGLRRLAREMPGEPETCYHLARGLLAVGEREAALASVDRALELDRRYLPAIALRSEITGRLDPVDPALEEGWVGLWRSAWRQLANRDPEGERTLTRLIETFEASAPPYTGFLAECYLARASVRLALGQHDLAAEDCILARARHPESPAADLLLGKVYLGAGRASSARHVFRRLRSRFPHDVLPFWVASVHLSTPQRDAREALEWARSVRDPALRERLVAYLSLRLRRWDDAVRASEAGVEAAPGDLVPRQLLAAARVGQALAAEGGGDVLAMAEACRLAIAAAPADRRSRYLLRAAREALRVVAPGVERARATETLATTAASIGLELPSDLTGSLVDDFSDGRVDDGQPLEWRVILECCPADVAIRSDGLRIRPPDPPDPPDPPGEPGESPGWLVTEDVVSGDLGLRVTADVGRADVHASLHVDLGTVSLVFGGVSATRGECEVGRMEYARVTRLHSAPFEPSEGADVEIELEASGSVVELRVWSVGSPRPEEPTLVLDGVERRLGAIGVSAKLSPATVRRVELRRLGAR